jgi:hypothetical protein
MGRDGATGGYSFATLGRAVAPGEMRRSHAVAAWYLRRLGSRTMAFYVVLHHPDDRSPSRWSNDWARGSRRRIKTITTNAKIAEDAEAAGSVYVHRCGFGDDAPMIVCEAKVISVVQIDGRKRTSDCLVTLRPCGSCAQCRPSHPSQEPTAMSPPSRSRSRCRSTALPRSTCRRPRCTVRYNLRGPASKLANARGHTRRRSPCPRRGDEVSSAPADTKGRRSARFARNARSGNADPEPCMGAPAWWGGAMPN